MATELLKCLMLISPSFEMCRSFFKLPDECGHLLPYPYGNLLQCCCLKGSVRGAFCTLPRHGFRGFVWEFCYDSRPFAIFKAGSLTLSVDSTTSSFFHFICMFVSAHFIFCFVLLVVLYRIVIVFRLVITDCASIVNFLLIPVITPCYVIIFALLCHP